MVIGGGDRRGSRGGDKRRSKGIQQTEKRLRETLKAAEAKQVKEWLQHAHKEVESDLQTTVTRLEPRSGGSRSRSPPKSRQSTGLLDADGVEVQGSALYVQGRAFDTVSLDGSNPSRLVYGHSRADHDCGGNGGHERIQSPVVSSKDQAVRVAFSPGSSKASIAAKLEGAMESAGIDGETLGEFLLPQVSSSRNSAARTIPLSEVEKVLAVDLFLDLSNHELAELASLYGDEDAMINVSAMLDDLLGVAPVRRRARPLSMEKEEGGEEKEEEEESHGFSSDHWRDRPPARESLQEERRYSAARMVQAVARGKSARESGAALRKPLSSSPATADMAAPEGGAEERPVTGSNSAAGHSREDTNGSSQTSKSSSPQHVHKLVDQHVLGKKKGLLEENERLRAELATFDRGFFDEIEDLKHSYSSLKRARAATGPTKDSPHPASDTIAAVLPSAGEETWGRSVDVAQRAVERGVRSESGPVPQGAHADRLAQAWESPSASPGRDAGKQSPGWSPRRRQQHQQRKELRGSGVVGAHERKLAWEIASGGLGGLKSLRARVELLGHDHNGFLAAGQLHSALNGAGYSMDARGVEMLKLGLGTDEKDRIDVQEFLQMCNDIARENEWYIELWEPASSTLDGLVTGSIKLGSPAGAGAIEGFQPAGEQGFLGGTEYGHCIFLPPVKTLDGVLAEVKEQLALCDLRRLSRGFGCTLSEGMSAPFRRRDVFDTGVLSAPDTALALHDVGVSLDEDEIRLLAHKFGASKLVESGKSSNSHGLQGVQGKRKAAEKEKEVDYAALVRCLVEGLVESRGIDPALGGNATLGPQGKWYERLAELADRLRKVLAKKTERGGWVKSLQQKFADFDMDGSGSLGRREFIRVLDLCGLELSEQEAKALLEHLDENKDGHISWNEFVEFFTKEGATGRFGEAVHEPWYVRECELADALLRHMEAQGGVADRRSWLNTVKRRFIMADADGNGTLDRVEFRTCIKNLKFGFSHEELDTLFNALDADNSDTVSYKELVAFFQRHQGDWWKAEPDLAEKIRLAMGREPASRAWLTRFRRSLSRIDTFRTGRIGASDLFEALREAGVYLSYDEEARLLDALETESEGGVSYGELLKFLALYAGKWVAALPNLAGRLRELVRSKAKTSADVRRVFRQFDINNDGVVGQDEFKVAMHRLFPSVRDEDLALMMEELDTDLNGSISYGDFLCFVNESNPWHRTEAELAERVVRAIKGSGGRDGKGKNTLRNLRALFNEADRDQNGFLSRREFRRVLDSCLAASQPDEKDKLRAEELELLMTLLDVDGNGQVSYRELLGLVLDHLGKWQQRIPEVASDLLFHLEQGEYSRRSTLTNLERRLEIADEMNLGRLGPQAMGRCLRSVGLGLKDTQLEDLVFALDTHNDGKIPYNAVLSFLRGDEREQGRQASGGASEGALLAFREAVWQLLGSGRTARRGSGGGGCSEDLRRVFDQHLDMDGDGFLSRGDLVLALPDIGCRLDGADVDVLMEALGGFKGRRSSTAQQVNFQRFSEFMAGRQRNQSSGKYHYNAIPAKQARVAMLRAYQDEGSPRREGGESGERGSGKVLAALRHQDFEQRGRLSVPQLKAVLFDLGLKPWVTAPAAWRSASAEAQDSLGGVFYEEFVLALGPALFEDSSSSPERSQRAPHRKDHYRDHCDSGYTQRQRRRGSANGSQSEHRSPSRDSTLRHKLARQKDGVKELRREVRRHSGSSHQQRQRHGRGERGRGRERGGDGTLRPFELRAAMERSGVELSERDQTYLVDTCRDARGLRMEKLLSFLE